MARHADLGGKVVGRADPSPEQGASYRFLLGCRGRCSLADRHGYFATELCPPGWRVLRPEAGCAILSIIPRTFDSLCSARWRGRTVISSRASRAVAASCRAEATRSTAPSGDHPRKASRQRLLITGAHPIPARTWLSAAQHMKHESAGTAFRAVTDRSHCCSWECERDCDSRGRVGPT